MSKGISAEDWRDLLVDLGQTVQHHLHKKQTLNAWARRGAEPVAEEGGDRIYRIDRNVDPVIEAEVNNWPDAVKPFIVVAEGFGDDGVLRVGPEDEPLKYRVLIDPIDGTRSLMYDKRSAWFLAAVAEDHGAETRLSHTFASVIVELPTAKLEWGDTFSAVRGGGAEGVRRRIDDTLRVKLEIVPSLAPDLRDGFAEVSSFFHGTKVLAAELMERIVAATIGKTAEGSAEVFDDQYISSAGQMIELILGHDRFVCDLRPLFYEILEQRGETAARGLECHPYDVAGALVATESGIILTDGFGQPLDCPFDVDYGVHWCGYANEKIHRLVEPVIQEWFRERGVEGFR